MSSFKFKFFLLGTLLAFSCNSLLATDVEFPLIQSLARFPFWIHQPLPKKHHSLILNFKYSNIFMFSKDHTSINDMETMNGTAAFRYGLTRSLTLELYLGGELVYGGIMDGMIDTFHRFWGISPGGRDLYPQYRVNYKYLDHFYHQKSQLVVTAPLIAALIQVAAVKNFTLTARAGLQLPLFAKPGFNSGEMTFLAGLMGRWERNRLAVEWNNHIAVFPQPSWMKGTEINHLIWHSEMVVRYKKYQAGIILRSSPIKTKELSNSAYQIYAGIKIRPNIEFLFIEEIPPLDTTPDFTFCFRFHFK